VQWDRRGDPLQKFVYPKGAKVHQGTKGRFLRAAPALDILPRLFRKNRQAQPLGMPNHRQLAPRADLRIGQ
jgi:hypothetical protein